MFDKIQSLNSTARICDLLHIHADKLAALEAHADALLALGITNAATYYRDGIYLYLIHPTQPDGTRQREYIGKDPAKIAAALARLDRSKEHAAVMAQIKSLASRLENVEYTLHQIKRDLERLA